jgi:hypothetical protein
MKIRCMTENGPCAVSVGHENCFFYAMLFATFGHWLAAFAGLENQSFIAGVADMVLIVLLLLMPCWLLLESIARLRLFRLGARRLRESEAPAVFKIIATESPGIFRRTFTTAHNARVYIMRRNARVTAMVLGGFMPKIVVSAGFCVVAERQPLVAGMILRHEMAHVRAGDTRLYAYRFLLTVSIAGAGIMLIAGLLRGNWVAGFLGLVNVLYLSFLFTELLSRREYIADAMALNHTSSVDEYQKILLQPNVIHGGAYHPSAAARVRALRERSPVLRTSVALVILSVLLACGGSVATLAHMERPDPEETNGFLFEDNEARNERIFRLGLVVSVIFPAITVFGELRKPLQLAWPAPAGTANHLSGGHAAERPNRTTGLWIISGWSLLLGGGFLTRLLQGLLEKDLRWRLLLLLLVNGLMGVWVALAIVSRHRVARVLTIAWYAVLLAVWSYSFVAWLTTHKGSAPGFTWVLELIPTAIYGAVILYMSRRKVRNLFRQPRSAKFINI